VERLGGAGNDSGSAVALDASGNIFLAGYFSGTANFGGSTFTSAGGTDMFLAKYNNAGVHQWSYGFGGTGNETVKAIAMDASGNIFIAGYYTGSGNFGGVTFTSAGSEDAFLAKYSAQGQHLWSQSFGSTGNDFFTGLAVDSQGNVVVTGSYQYSVNFGGATFSSLGYPNIVLAKYSTTGAHLWSETFASGNSNWANGVALDKNDNILLTGSFLYRIDFGGGYIYSTPASNEDIFVAKFATSGAYVWGKRYGGTNTDRGSCIGVDGNGDVIVGGMFYLQTDLGGGTINGQGSDNDLFLAKYSGLDGSYVWSKPLVGNDGGGANAVQCDAQNNIVLTGYYYGSVNFGAQVLSSSALSNDGFAAKYTSAGVPVWASGFGGTSSDGGTSIAIDTTGHSVITGVFNGTANFAGTPLLSAGGSDAFLMRLNP
jgi:hypothetical protein